MMYSMDSGVDCASDRVGVGRVWDVAGSQPSG